MDAFYFTLWALRRREGYVQVGFYTQQPFYQPPALGDVMGEPREFVTDDDVLMAEAIDRCVAEMSHERPKLVFALEVWEGAYRNASPTRGQRCRDRYISYDACRKGAKRCKQEIDRRLAQRD